MLSLFIPAARKRLPSEQVEGAGRHRPDKHAVRMLLLACGMASCVTPDAAAAQGSAPPPAAATPTAFELQLFYADRTWNWDDGAAYFAQDRRMRAWTSTPDAASVAEGTWHLSNDGEMCMNLVWRSTTYAPKPIRTCFSHRVRNGIVEQRKEPDGQWYSFRHASGDPADELKKIQAGDTRGADFEKIQKLVDSKS